MELGRSVLPRMGLLSTEHLGHTDRYCTSLIILFLERQLSQSYIQCSVTKVQWGTIVPVVMNIQRSHNFWGVTPCSPLKLGRALLASCWFHAALRKHESYKCKATSTFTGAFVVLYLCNCDL